MSQTSTGAFEYAGEDSTLDLSDERPRTRADCVDGPRPCPWIGCRYHLGVEVTGAGSIKVFDRDDQSTVTVARAPRWRANQSLPLAEDALWRLLESGDDTCALDIAERGGVSMDAVGRILCTSKQRVHQIESDGLAKVKRAVLAHEDCEDRFGIDL